MPYNAHVMFLFTYVTFSLSLCLLMIMSDSYPKHAASVCFLWREKVRVMHYLSAVAKLVFNFNHHLNINSLTCLSS